MSAIHSIPTARGLTFLVNDWDRPVTDGSFGNKFRDWCNYVELYERLLFIAPSREHLGCRPSYFLLARLNAIEP